MRAMVGQEHLDRVAASHLPGTVITVRPPVTR
jgi:hypothetical protein